MGMKDVTVKCPICEQSHTYSRGVGATVRCQSGNGSFRLTQRLVTDYQPVADSGENVATAIATST